MPPASATKAARFRMTMRRVRLEVAARPRLLSGLRSGFRICPSAFRRPAAKDFRRAASSVRLTSATIRCARSFSGLASLALPETVSHPVERLDHIELVVHRLELLPQALDVAVDGAIVDIHLVII